jgi:hypothetical protein
METPNSQVEKAPKEQRELSLSLKIAMQERSKGWLTKGRYTILL